MKFPGCPRKHTDPSPHLDRLEDTNVSSQARASQTDASAQLQLLQSPTSCCQQHAICISDFLFLQAKGVKMGQLN